MKNKISIVIRTYNEEKHLPELLEALENQTYRNFDVILVDSESTDGTISKAIKTPKTYSLKIVKIKKQDFTYSFASNVGVQNSTGNLICFLSGHSVPIDKKYLNAVNETFQNPKIGGCYGDVIVNNDASIYEKIYNNLGILKNKFRNPKGNIIIEQKLHKGILSCNNACIRKKLLVKHPFAEGLGYRGGEDAEVAYRILKDGYYVAMNPKMIVRHSHGLRLKKFIQELKTWDSIYAEVLAYIKERP